MSQIQTLFKEIGKHPSRAQLTRYRRREFLSAKSRGERLTIEYPFFDVVKIYFIQKLGEYGFSIKETRILLGHFEKILKTNPQTNFFNDPKKICQRGTLFDQHVVTITNRKSLSIYIGSVNAGQHDTLLLPLGKPVAILAANWLGLKNRLRYEKKKAKAKKRLH